MEQQTKIIILAVLVAVVVAGNVYLIQSKMSGGAANTQQITQISQTATSTKPSATREIIGKIRSFNAKAIYIELADGKGFAVGIQPQIPVMTQGAAKPGSLVDIKFGQNITATVDEKNDAVQILILPAK